MRIVVAMSGGVDSSVAASLLAEQGHDVIGLSMQLYPSAGSGQALSAGSGQAPPAGSGQATREERFGSCCTLDDLHDARRVAAARTADRETPATAPSHSIDEEASVEMRLRALVQALEDRGVLTREDYLEALRRVLGER